MNILIKTAIIGWLLLCIPVVWIGCALVGFIMCFSSHAFMYNVTPFIGATILICIIKCIITISKTDPVAYMSDLFNKVENFFGKKKV